MVDTASSPAADEALRSASRDLGGGRFRLDLMVPDMHCAGCIRSIERGLAELEQVITARANLGERRVAVTWKQGRVGEGPEDGARDGVRDGAAAAVGAHGITDKLEALGFVWHLADDADTAHETEILRELLWSLAVAGFATANVMLLSVSVWSGAMSETRDLFHWISALIAVPAVFYAGRPFYRSAWRSLAGRRLNMDVPVSLAVLLALFMSLYEVARGGPHAYFDAAVSLLFFLLIGRVLDQVMRRRAHRAVSALARLVPAGATAVDCAGKHVFQPLERILTGSRILIRPGDRVPIDACILSGTGDIDCSLISGESAPVTIGPGAVLRAGMLNLNGVIEARTIAPVEDSFVSRMREMMAAAEHSRGPFRKIADRMAEIYGPAVHILALLTFLGWVLASGDWHQALLAAITVLIITCPCALGLAVPIVQVVAAGRLFENGVMMRSGDALERLALVDRAFFDKTGTLTMGQAGLVESVAHDNQALAVAASLAKGGSRPLAQALVQAAEARGLILPPCTDAREKPGHGMEGVVDGRRVRLGRADWCGGSPDPSDDGYSTSVLSVDGRIVERFRFTDTDRPDARDAISGIQHLGIDTEILSGDRQSIVDGMAGRLNITHTAGGLLPQDKVARVTEARANGHTILMVGDGINDAPVMAAADVSMAPVSAADIGRGQADFVFLRESLMAVPETVRTARLAMRLIKQNIGLALAYNCIAVPLAMFGLATPLVAAIAMSSSSILVTLNALRLYRRGRDPKPNTAAIQPAEVTA